MSGDDFAEMMRRVDPARTTRDTRTEAEFQADLAEVFARPAKKARHRNRWITLSAAAAVLVAVFVITPLLGNPAHAHAATPPMLAVQSVPDSLDEILTQSQHSLIATQARSAERRAESEGWYLDTEVDEAGEPVSIVTPQIRVAEWEQDLSGQIVVTAGEAYLPKDGRTYPPPAGKAPDPGTVLSDDRYAAGEMPLLFPAEPPTTDTEMRAYLESGGAIPEEGALSYVNAARTLLDEWTLSGQQHAALLGVLLNLDGIEVAGEALDRLGRPSFVIRVTSAESPHREFLLLIERDTGRFGALETVYLGGVPELDLPSPAVTAYVCWR